MDFSGIAAGACVRLEAAFICIFHHRGRPTLAAPTLCAGCGRRHFGSPPLFRCFSLIFLCFCFCFELALLLRYDYDDSDGAIVSEAATF